MNINSMVLDTHQCQFYLIKIHLIFVLDREKSFFGIFIFEAKQEIPNGMWHTKGGLLQGFARHNRVFTKEGPCGWQGVLNIVFLSDLPCLQG
jgi:hypothetical protein